MTPQVDAAIATNTALKRNHLEIAGMQSSFSLTNLPGIVTSCLNNVPLLELFDRSMVTSRSQSGAKQTSGRRAPKTMRMTRNAALATSITELRKGAHLHILLAFGASRESRGITELSQMVVEYRIWILGTPFGQ